MTMDDPGENGDRNELSTFLSGFVQKVKSMTDHRKKKSSPAEEQYNLWDAMPVCKKDQSEDINQESDSSDIAQKQNELNSLSQALAVAKKRISRLERQLEKEKIRNDGNKHAFLRKLFAQLPAFLLFEVLKSVKGDVGSKTTCDSAISI